MAHGEVDRAGDETKSCRLVVKNCSRTAHGLFRDGDQGPEHDVAELATSVGQFDHRSDRRVAVGGYPDARARGEVQVPEHVALRERGNEQLLRVPARNITTEGDVRRARDNRLGPGADLVVAAVCTIAAGTGLVAACPLHKNLIDVCAAHDDMVRIRARSIPKAGHPVSSEVTKIEGGRPVSRRIGLSIWADEHGAKRSFEV